MNIETAKEFLMWCTVLNYGLLVIWSVVFKLAHDWHFELTRQWFPGLPVERYDMVNLLGMAIFKISVIVFNLVPYIALCIISRN